jgi:uncharacterized protein (TIGR01655 family)
LIVVVAIWGKQYYDSRYVGTDYYTMVPLDYDMTSVDMNDMNGKVIGTGIKYNLTAYNEQGDAKTVFFKVYDPDSDISRGEKQPQPGTYLLVSVSEQIVLKWSVTEESNIPEKALAKIKGS